MNPEARKIYIESVTKQLDEAEKYQQTRARATAQECASCCDPLDKAALRFGSPCRLSHSPAACRNTLALLKELPDQPLKTIAHGAQITTIDLHPDTDLFSPEKNYIFIDPKECSSFEIVNNSRSALASIPNCPGNFLRADSVAGKNLRGKHAGDIVRYPDLEGKEIAIKIDRVE